MIIIGAAVGGAICLALCVVGIFLAIYRKKKQKKTKSPSSDIELQQQKNNYSGILCMSW